MGLAEGMAADDQRGGLLVVHRHPAERLADVDGRSQWIRLALGPFGIDVYQAHRGGAVRLGEITLAGVALVGAQPFVLLTEEDLLGLPDVGPAEAEPESLKARRLQRHIAGEHQQVGPRDLVAVLLLDRPQQPACLVQVGVVGPTVERGEALHALPATAAAVVDAVGARGVPAHADEQSGIAAVVGRPPVLRGGDDRQHVGLQRLGVDLGEFLGVVEVFTVGVGRRSVRVQFRHVDLVGPPVLVGERSARLGLGRVDDRVFALTSAARRRLLGKRRLGVGCIRHNIPSRGW